MTLISLTSNNSEVTAYLWKCNKCHLLSLSLLCLFQLLILLGTENNVLLQLLFLCETQAAAAAGGTHPGFELLVEDGPLSHTVLFVGLHLLRDVLLGHLAEDFPVLRGLLEDFLLMLTDVSEMFQHFHLPTLIKRDTSSKRLIALYWKDTSFPPISHWLNELSLCLALEKLTYSTKQKLCEFYKIWGLFLQFLESTDL